MSEGIQLDGRLEQHAGRIAEESPVITTAGSINKLKPGYATATGNLQTKLSHLLPEFNVRGVKHNFDSYKVMDTKVKAKVNLFLRGC